MSHTLWKFLLLAFSLKTFQVYLTSFIRSTRQETACISEESSCISICFFFTVKCGKRVDRVYQSSGRLTELESLKWKQNFYCLNNVTVFCCLPSSNESCSQKPSSAERSSYKTKKRERFYFLVWSFLISDHFNRANSRSKFTSEFCLSPGSRAHTHSVSQSAIPASLRPWACEAPETSIANYVSH